MLSESNILFVTGGYEKGRAGVKNSEIVDINPPPGAPKCKNLTPFPYAQFGAVATFIDEQLMVCGGRPSNPCLYYNNVTGKWDKSSTMMIEKKRIQSGFVMVNDTHWWLVGGYESGPTTEIYSSVTKKFEYDVELPYHLGGKGSPSLFKVNETHYVLCCLDNIKDNYIFDMTTMDWTVMPRSQGEFAHCYNLLNPQLLYLRLLSTAKKLFYFETMTEK